MVRMVSLPWDNGSLVTNSTVICDQGHPGTGSGRRIPAGHRWVAFPRAHTVQALTHSGVSAATVGHQKWRWSRDKVQKAPGRQANQDVWLHWRTWGQTETGNKWPWGPPPGSGLVCRAVLTKYSISHIRINIFAPWLVSEIEIKSTKEQSPPGLARVQTFSTVNIS